MQVEKWISACLFASEKVCFCNLCVFEMNVVCGSFSSPQVKRAALLGGLVFLFFFFMSRIDYIVNGTLYSYRIKFSYDWADSYWLTYNAVFVVFAAMVAVTYWLGSKKTHCDQKIGVALFATVSMLALGGLQDVMFFLVWGGGLPPSNVSWWWTPWISILGTWNSLTQLALTFSTLCISAATWIMVLKRKNRR